MNNVKTFRIELVHLEAQAKSRPAGYLEEVKSKGTVNGPYLEIPIDAYMELFRKYSPIQRAPQTASWAHMSPEASASISRKQSIRGIGDVVAKVAQPIAKTIDSVIGTNIQNCGGCKKRQEKLNNMFPFKPNTNVTSSTIY